MKSLRAVSALFQSLIFSIIFKNKYLNKENGKFFARSIQWDQKLWVAIQWGQSYHMGGSCLISLLRATLHVI